MDKLPYELLCMIFADLSQEDTINLPIQMTSRALSDKVFLSDYSIIDVWLDERSLRTLARAAIHPLLRYNIHGLRFHTDELARVSFLEFKCHYTRRKGRPELSRLDDCELDRYHEEEEKTLNERSLDISQTFQRYESYYNAQESQGAGG